MLPTIHIANTDFEVELANSNLKSVLLPSSSPICLQLEFLPLLYASPQDIILVSYLPQTSYLNFLSTHKWFQKGLPTFKLFTDEINFSSYTCRLWGASHQFNQWALARGINHLETFSLTLIKEINSKKFSFNAFHLNQATLITNKNDLKNWMHSFEGEKIIKTCFGLSGSGNRRISSNVISSKLLFFCEQEWKQGRPLIAEPWLDKVIDFSTQWEIDSHQKIIFKGSTRFETNSQGIYQATLAGPQHLLFIEHLHFLEDHLDIVLPILETISKKGYKGCIGIDALIYRCARTRSLKLYPLVEINARQTMSSVALEVQQNHFPEQQIRFAYLPKMQPDSLLPSCVCMPTGELIPFRHSLTVSPLISI